MRWVRDSDSALCSCAAQLRVWLPLLSPSLRSPFCALCLCSDGVASTEERVIFMTTNHLERLDPALIRPGRVDVQLEIGHATPPQIRGMFLRFFPDAKKEAGEFVERLARASEARKAAGQSSTLSMAELQGFFLVHKHSLHTAMEHVDQIHDSKKQMAVASSFVNTIRAANTQAAAATATPGVERVTAVPDVQVHPDVVEQIKKRIAAEEAAAEAAAATSGNKQTL